MVNNEEDSLNKLEKKLYSKTAYRPKEVHSDFSRQRPKNETDWSDEAAINDVGYLGAERPRHRSPVHSLVVGSVIFFLLAVLVSIYFFFSGTNVISPENVDLTLSGPISLKGGDELDLLASVTNHNSVALESATLVVTFPDGTKTADGGNKDLTKFVQNLGTIQPNETINQNIKAIVFGQEGSPESIDVTLEYRPSGSSGTFAKDKNFSVLISSSPLSVNLDLPANVTPDQDTVASISVNSNSTELLHDVLVSAVYPPGFIFKSADPSPTYGNNVWAIGDVPSGSQHSIKISGQLQGQDGDIKSFRVSAGVRGGQNDTKISSVYGSSEKSLSISKPSIGLDLTLNGDSEDEVVISPHDTVRGDITWTNNLPVQILNSQIGVQLTGDTVNKSSVNTSSGFYNSASNIVTWDKNTGGLSSSINPGDSGQESFSFSLLPLIQSSQTISKNPTITLELKFIGVKFASGSSQSEVVSGSITKKIKISSDLQLATKTLYYAGPFKNSGPLPPTHNLPTTYTIIWSVVNSSNDVTDATVKASLPSYVKWLDNVSPSSEDISYNQLGGEIIWKIGNLPAGTGVTSEARTVAFQVGITPSISQVAGYPVLVSDATVSGGDNFTQSQISATNKALTLELPNDLGVSKAEYGPVQ